MTLVPCEACGKPISDRARDCPECGHPVSGEYLVKRRQYEVQAAADAVIQEQRDRKAASLGTGIGYLIIVATLLFFWWLFSGLIRMAPSGEMPPPTAAEQAIAAKQKSLTAVRDAHAHQIYGRPYRKLPAEHRALVDESIARDAVR